MKNIPRVILKMVAAVAVSSLLLLSSCALANTTTVGINEKKVSALQPFISVPPIIPSFGSKGQTPAVIISQISRFRSVVGHPYYTGDKLKCQSEKHYFTFCQGLKPTDILIQAPCYGTITTVRHEQMGDQIEITVDTQKYPDYRGRNIAVILFHINPFAPFVEGQKVYPGKELGTHYTMDTYSDMAVREYYQDKDPVLRSAFDFMSPQVLAMYNIKDASRMTIAQEERDAYPSACTNPYDPMPEPPPGGPDDWVVINNCYGK